VKINALEVDGFGVWSGLKLDGLSEGLNVFFGPNEAGKTTLMQFIRSVFYGSSGARSRYLPPIHGGQAGGSLWLSGPEGRLQLARHFPAQEPGGSGTVTITGADGTRQGEHLLRVLFSNVDEATYNNVFSVGLSELQELGALGETEAAAMLYSLSAGLDRVPLVEVLRELDRSRNRILDCGGGPCEISALVAQREKLSAELVQIGTLGRNYSRLTADRDQLDRETARLEEENRGLAHEARVIEIAAALTPRWRERAELDEKLKALGPVRAVPEGAVQRLEMLDQKLDERKRQADELKRRWREARDEALSLEINETLWRLAPRVETLREQTDWIRTLEARLGELQAEITDLQGQLSRQRELCGWGEESPSGRFPTISAESLSRLRSPARAMRRSRQLLEEAQQEDAAKREEARSLCERMAAELAARGAEKLSDAVDRAADLVAQLRRREQVDQRLEQMESYQLELEEQSRRLLGRQILPIWVILALGVLFVFGVVLVGLAFMEWVGWTFAILGSVGAIASLAAKFLFERSATLKLDACQKQLRMLRTQIREAKVDRDALDERLPGGDGSTALRLKAAERGLAALEELVPLDSQREAAERESQEAAERLRQAQSRLAEAGRGWQEELRRQGLPEKLAPRQIRDLSGRCLEISDLGRRLEIRREEYEQRRRELSAFAERVGRLSADLDLNVEPGRALHCLEELAAQIALQEANLQRREALRGQCRQLRRKRARYERAVSQLKRRRLGLLRDVEADDEAEFRRRVARHAEAASLGDRRSAVEREIDAAIGGHCSQEVIAEKLRAGAVEELPRRLAELKARLEENGRKLRQRIEERGRLAEQLRTLADDRLPLAKRLDLAMLEKRLQEAIFRWQVRAVAGRMLDGVRSVYERDRQPETLQEASSYLKRLTGGRYSRVWTPLGEEVLRVDDAQGRSLPVEVLSQGAREQLFLCLRLSLLSSFARRGAVLPMILDDVLVNFDSVRAKATAAVLRDFAATGHQMFVFTCHEHIVRLFKSLRVTVSELPDNGELEIRSAADRKTPKRRSGRREPPPLVPRKLVAEASHATVEEEIELTLPEEPELILEEPLLEDETFEEEETEEPLPPLDEDDEEDADEEDDDDEVEKVHQPVFTDEEESVQGHGDEWDDEYEDEYDDADYEEEDEEEEDEEDEEEEEEEEDDEYDDEFDDGEYDDEAEAA
jgi:uncharacterized protein YhaN